MGSRGIASFVLVMLLAYAVCAQSPATPKKKVPVDANKFALVINGAGGEPEYAKQFEAWTGQLSAVLTERFGFDARNLKVLSEKPADANGPRATAEEVRRTFATLKSQLDANNVLFVFLIGHGSFDGKESKFNLVGPDLPASEYNTMLAALPTRRVVLFNMSSASGEFIKSLAAKGRIIITATRSGQETNATRFAGFLIAALTATDADTDQDGHTSVLEAFVYANRLTADFYKRAGRLATEHALLDDNGDGVGHDKVEAGEGLLARATYLDSLSVDEAAASAATGRLLKERTRLEGEIEQLIARKGMMNEAEYETTLERLFIELAKVNRSIKQAGT
jgi:Caspase domain